MRDVKMEKAVLVKKLRENRKKHIEEFGTAYEGFRKQYIEKVTQMLNAAKQGDFDLEEDVDLEAPVSYEQEYNTAIQMLEMSCEGEVTINKGEFDNYIMDDWAWSSRFSSSSASYGSSSSSSLKH